MAGWVAAGMAAAPRPAGPEGPTAWAAAVGALLFAVALGYAVGRRRGRREGYRLGRAEAPLLLRAEALVRGACPVCDGDPGAAPAGGDGRPRGDEVAPQRRAPGPRAPARRAGGRAAPDPADPEPDGPGGPGPP